MRAGHRPFNLLSNQLQPIQITSASLQSQINRHSGGRINRLAVAPFPFKSPDTLESKNRHNLIDRKSLNRSMSTLNKLIFFLKKNWAKFERFGGDKRVQCAPGQSNGETWECLDRTISQISWPLSVCKYLFFFNLINPISKCFRPHFYGFSLREAKCLRFSSGRQKEKDDRGDLFRTPVAGDWLHCFAPLTETQRNKRAEPPSEKKKKIK